MTIPTLGMSNNGNNILEQHLYVNIECRIPRESYLCTPQLCFYVRIRDGNSYEEIFFTKTSKI